MAELVEVKIELRPLQVWFCYLNLEMGLVVLGYMLNDIKLAGISLG